MSGTDMRINLEIREREIAAKDEEIKELKAGNEKLKDYRTEVFEIEKILGRWEEIRDNQI
jgi:hypothetical protein